MKILQIINNLNTGGAEKLILETVPLCNREADLQMDVAVINGFEYPFLKALKKQGVCSIHSLGFKNVYNPLVIFKLIPLLKQYQIIHVHLFPALYWVALAKFMSVSNAKLIYTEHSTSNKRRKNLVFKYVDRVIYSFYSKIITISPEVDSHLKMHLGFKDSIFELIQNGVNLEAMKQIQPLLKNQLHKNLSQDSFLLVQVSSFRYPKDQQTVIKALKTLNNRVQLILVGDGPLRNECEALAQQLGLKDRVHFLGIRMDVIQILKASDVVILSSHHEGLSLSCVEGMASGKPFVATDAPGLGDIVRNAGVVFPIGNHHKLSEILNALQNEPNYYHTIVEKCLDRAQNFNITHTIAKEIRLYKTLLAK